MVCINVATSYYTVHAFNSYNVVQSFTRCVMLTLYNSVFTVYALLLGLTNMCEVGLFIQVIYLRFIICISGFYSSLKNWTVPVMFMLYMECFMHSNLIFYSVYALCTLFSVYINLSPTSYSLGYSSGVELVIGKRET